MKNFVFVSLVNSFSAIALGQAWDVSVTSEKLGHFNNEGLIVSYLEDYNTSELHRKCHPDIGSLLNINHTASSEPQGQLILVQVESNGLCVPDRG
jgi:hypothetical protein